MVSVLAVDKGEGWWVMGGKGGYGDARTWEATVYSFRGDSFFSVVETKGGFGEGVGMGFFMEEW